MGQSLKRDIFWLFLIKISQVGLNFATGVIIARALGPFDRGILGIFGAITVILTYFCDIGITSASLYFLGKQQAQLSKINTNIIVWDFVVVGLLVVMSTVVLSRDFLTQLFPDVPVVYIWLALITVPFSMYVSQWSAVMTGLNKIRHARQFGLVNQVIALGFTAFIVLVMKWPLIILVGFSVLANICIAAVAFRLLRQYSPEPLIFNFDLQTLKKSMQYGLNAYLGLLVLMLHLRLDIFLIGSLKGPAQVGFYAVAVGLVEGMQYIDSAISDAILFRLTNETQAESRELVCRTTRHTAFIMAFVAIGMILFSYPTILVIYGQEYLPSVIPLILLVPGVLALSLTRPLGAFIAFQLGRPGLNLITVLSGLVVNFTLNLRFIPAHGINGAALASTISYATTLILVIWVFKQLTGATLRDTFVLKQQDIQLYFNLLSRVKFFIQATSSEAK